MNGSKALVSIIIPMYNAEKYIEETMQSVIDQSYNNWELIIVDDCSTDYSREIVRDYINKEDRIKLIETGANFGGPARPRNIGMQNAKGEYMAFLDADDVWLSIKLENQVSFLQQNLDIDICHTLAYVIDENSNKKGVFKNQRGYKILKTFISKKNLLFYTNNININSVLMKADLAISFDEDINCKASDDWIFWIDNHGIGKQFKLLEQRLMNYRIHSTSLSNRSTDIGYRRSLYLLSKLFMNKKISFKHYIGSIFLNLLNIFKKNSKL